MSSSPESPLKILIVDDEPNVAETLELAIVEALSPVDVCIKMNFDEALSLIRSESFDIVVLDLFRGYIGEGDNVGQELWKSVLNEKFVPVVVYTAGECDLEPGFPENNPVLKCFTKDAASSGEIVSHLLTIKPYLLEIREVQREFDEAIKKVLLETSPFIWQAEAEAELRPQRVLRSARRRLAAMMDLNTISTGERMLFWEQYLVPPLDNCLLTGDLLRTREGDSQDPTAYRLVLTPSCDLVVREGRDGVSDVLVAKCVRLDKFVTASGMTISDNLGRKRKEKAREKLSALLTQAQTGGYVFLPGYKSVLPTMTACLRDLELIPRKDIAVIAGAEGTFVRIASVDSPFREHLAWAYLQIAGRPGLPDRNLDQCIDENFEILRLPD